MRLGLTINETGKNCLLLEVRKLTPLEYTKSSLEYTKPETLCLSKSPFLSFGCIGIQPGVGPVTTTPIGRTFLYSHAFNGASPTELWRLLLDGPSTSLEVWRFVGTLASSYRGFYLALDASTYKLGFCDPGSSYLLSNLSLDITTTIADVNISNNFGFAIDGTSRYIYAGYGGVPGGSITRRPYPAGVVSTNYYTASTETFSTGSYFIAPRQTALGLLPHLTFFSRTSGFFGIYQLALTSTPSSASQIISYTNDSDSQKPVDPGVGPWGTLFTHRTLGSPTGVNKIDLLLQSQVNLTTNPSTVLALDTLNQQFYTLRDESNPSFDATPQLRNYDGTFVRNFLNHPKTSSLGFQFIRFNRGNPNILKTYHKQLGFLLDIDPTRETYTSPTGNTTAINDGDSVGLINDLGPAALSFSQSTPANRPTLRIESGVTVLELDGTNDTLSASLSAGESQRILRSGHFSAYTVIKQTGTQARNTLFLLASPDATNQINVHPTWDDTLYFDYGEASFPSNGRISGPQPGGWDDTWHLVEYHRNGTTLSEIIVDGVSAVSGAMSDTFSVALGGTVHLFSSNGSFHQEGRFARLLWYRAFHDTTTRANVRSKLQTLYSALGI